MGGLKGGVDRGEREQGCESAGVFVVPSPEGRVPVNPALPESVHSAGWKQAHAHAAAAGPAAAPCCCARSPARVALTGTVLTKVVKERPLARVKAMTEVEGRLARAVTHTSGTAVHSHSALTCGAVGGRSVTKTK